jgi:hypothetical protein
MSVAIRTSGHAQIARKGRRCSDIRELWLPSGMEFSGHSRLANRSPSPQGVRRLRDPDLTSPRRRARVWPSYAFAGARASRVGWTSLATPVSATAWGRRAATGSGRVCMKARSALRTAKAHGRTRALANVSDSAGQTTGFAQRDRRPRRACRRPVAVCRAFTKRTSSSSQNEPRPDDPQQGLLNLNEIY